jgi:hypothetical protein
LKKATGFAKIGGLEFNSINIDASHKSIFDLQFIFGGKQVILLIIIIISSITTGLMGRLQISFSELGKEDM